MYSEVLPPVFSISTGAIESDKVNITGVNYVADIKTRKSTEGMYSRKR